MKTITKTLRLLAVLLLLISGKNAFSQGCTASFIYNIGANGAVTFSSTSVPVNSITTQYYWTFGNGAPTFTTVGNPTASQTYTANGTYTVTLFFLTPATCSNQATSVITITNASSCNQVANFTGSQQANGLWLFTNLTTNTLVSTTYAWNFGDLGTSTSISPGHTYANNGTYTVTLTATTGTCMNTKTLVINVTSICNLVANIAYTLGSNGLVNFSSTSVGTNSFTSYYWNFGNGFTAQGVNMVNTSQTYTANGTYVVILKDSLFSPFPCVSIATATIVVSNITNPCNLNANFSSNQPGGGVVNFNNTSTGISGGVTYAWSFGDGGTSASASPAHTYSNSGAYTVTLTANNNYSYACAATKTAVINVNLCNLNAAFTYSMAPNGQVNFYNTSTGTSSLTTYAWYFGNGQTSGSANPSITFTANGSYFVSLYVTSGSPACMDSTGYTINVTNICNISASFSHTVGASGVVNFYNTSLGTNSLTTYYWNYGDGTFGSGANPTHTYGSAGTYVAVLVAMNGSTLCANSASQSINVTGIACVANSNFSLNPTNTPQYWTATPSFPWNVTSAVWNWGDGSSSNLLYTSHTYSAAGMYNICLTVTVSCGSSASTCATYSISRTSNTMIQVNVIDPDLVEVGIQNINSSLIEASIYPNPSNGEFTIHLNGLSQEKVGISIYNLLGEKVYTTETEAVNGELIKEMQIGQVPNGIYVLRINSQNKTYSQKIMFDK